MKWIVSALMAAFLWASGAQVLQAGDGDVKANVQTITGTAGCAKCNYEKETKSAIHVLCVKEGDNLYFIRPSATADDDTKKKITKDLHEIKGEITVSGTVEDVAGVKWIAANTIKSAVKSELPPVKDKGAPPKEPRADQK